MKTKVGSNLLFVVALLVFFCPRPSWTQAGQDAQATDNNNTAPSATQDSAAAQMVPAQAILEKDLDGKTAQSGQQFRATLSSTIQLKNGPELPRGTVLVGTVAGGSGTGNGATTLALRFSQANLKDGKSIPIVATIVGIAPPQRNDGAFDTNDVAPPESWDGKTLQSDIVGAESGVDLHSKIAGENSGVFVTTKKSDVKLAASSQLALAIGAQSAVAGMNGGN
jgi:hypothetical protein